MDREQIFAAARALAIEAGLINLTLAELCQRVGIPRGSFQAICGVSFVEMVTRLSAEVGPQQFDVTRERAYPQLRRGNILAAAVDLAVEHGYATLSREQVAEGAGVSPALVTRYFGSMEMLRKHVMAEAVFQKVLPIVAQGLTARDPMALRAPEALKVAAVQSINTR